MCNKKRLKKDKKGVDKRIKIVYNKRCRKSLQRPLANEYMEKYSRGRRGAPAKGVGRLSRRESSNLSFSARKRLRIGYNPESFSTKSAFVGINPLSWMKSLRDEICLTAG